MPRNRQTREIGFTTRESKRAFYLKWKKVRRENCILSNNLANFCILERIEKEIVALELSIVCILYVTLCTVVWESGLRIGIPIGY